MPEHQIAPERQRVVERAPDPQTADGEARVTKRPPGSGWELGAAGLGKVSWAGLTILLVAIGIVLLLSGYMGYGAMILVLAAAAGVNLR